MITTKKTKTKKTTKKKTSTRKPRITWRTVNIGAGLDLVIRIPEGAIDPTFLPDAIDDIRATYKRCLKRSWKSFAREYTKRFGAEFKRQAVRS